MASKGTLKVRIIGDAAPLEKSLGKITKGVAAFGAGVAAVGLAVGKSLFDIGRTFDDAFDTIRIGTGATGEALAALQDDFRAVAKDTPATFEDIGTAVADLNTRLGLTGEPLQELAGQLLDLSRITKTDVAANVADVTRVFGDWDIAVADQAATLDKLFRASQSTGITIDRLNQSVVQSGAPLRQLGFSFEQAIALISKFEKEGVNAEAVLGGMRQALGRMAKAGEEPIETFQRLSEAIANAGSVGESNAIAVEAFGSRAGPDLAAAIREGRFAVEDLVDVINNGSDTISKAADDTEDFSEKWQQFKNNVLLQLEGPATRVFDRLGEIVEGLIPVVERVGAAFEKDGLGGAMEVLLAEWQKFMDSGAFEAMVARFAELGARMGAAVVGGIVKFLLSPAAIHAIGGALDEIIANIPIVGRVVGAVESAGDFLGENVLGIQQQPLPPLNLPTATNDTRNAPTRDEDKLADVLYGGTFDDGGVVPGRVGTPTLVMAHAGETIVPTHKGRGVGTTVNVTLNAPNYVGSREELRRTFQEMMRDYFRTNGNLGLGAV